MTLNNFYIETMFNKVYNGHPNLITNHIIRYGRIGRTAYLYELSYGGGLIVSHIYGVTIIKMVGNENEAERTIDLSKSFSGNNRVDVIQKAEDYIEELETKLF